MQKSKKHLIRILHIILVIFSLLPVIHGQTDKQILDQVVAVIGDNMITESEVYERYIQIKQSGQNLRMSEKAAKCRLLEELLLQNLLLDQAKIDSITIEMSQVELQLQQRLDFFIERIGSVEKLENYFDQSLSDIKEDLRKSLRDQMLTERMRQEIIKNVKPTPSEIKEYYQSLSKDSIPYVEAKIIMAQIVKYPEYSGKAILEVKQKLLDLRKRIMEGEEFSTLAVLYSEGEKATRGGELGYKGKGELPPKYAEAAFRLKKGGISKIFETEQGFHIIKLIDQKDNKVKTQQILIRPDYVPNTIEQTKKYLDSIATLIRTSDDLSFEKAAIKYSEDQATQKSGGIILNSNTGTSEFEMDELQPNDFYIVKNLNEGQISEPYESIDENGRTLYKIIMIKSKVKPHKANLEEDYNLIKNMLKAKKQQEVFVEWIQKKQKTTFIRIDENYQACDFNFKGWSNDE